MESRLKPRLYQNLMTFWPWYGARELVKNRSFGAVMISKLVGKAPHALCWRLGKEFAEIVYLLGTYCSGCISFLFLFVIIQIKLGIPKIAADFCAKRGIAGKQVFKCTPGVKIDPSIRRYVFAQRLRKVVSESISARAVGCFAEAGWGLEWS